MASIMKNMDEILEGITKLDGVTGVFLLSGENKLVAQKFSGMKPLNIANQKWTPSFSMPEKINEAEMIYENGRIFARRVDQGYLLVLMSASAPLSMIKLDCDVACAALKQTGGKKGFFGLFGK